jgi:hypothetical protein
LGNTAGDVTVSKDVACGSVTNGALEKQAFCVAGATQDVDGWFNSATQLTVQLP